MQMCMHKSKLRMAGFIAAALNVKFQVDRSEKQERDRKNTCCFNKATTHNPEKHTLKNKRKRVRARDRW